MRNTKAALAWIVGILNELKIPFEIDGGLAAEMYGSDRELVDIDINIPEDQFGRLGPLVKEYITFGPKQYKDENWDLYMMTLKYAGQNIDIGTLGNMKYFDKKEGVWKDVSPDLSDCRIMDYMGMKLPFVNEIKLMIYKQGLDRGVDKKDLHAVEGQLRKEWSA